MGSAISADTSACNKRTININCCNGYVSNLEIFLKNNLTYPYVTQNDIKNFEKLGHRIIKIDKQRHDCFILTYMNNSTWSEPWHLEARRPICYYCNEHKKWHVVNVMDKGPEVSIRGTETQDICGNPKNYVKHLQHIIDGVSNEKENTCDTIEKIILTYKVDGALCRMFRFRKNTCAEQFFTNLLDNDTKAKNDELLQLFIQYGRKYFNGDLLLFASSDKLYLTSKPHQYTFIASIAYEFGVPHQYFHIFREQQANPVDVAKYVFPDEKTLLEKFFEKLSSIIILPNVISTVYHFEMILPNRTNPINGDVMVDLAVDYENGGLMFLGSVFCYACGHYITKPHMKLEHNFSQPKHIKVNSFTDVIIAIDHLDEYACGRFTLDEFVEKYDIKPTDLEGFIMYVLMDVNGVKKWVYTKVKTTTYYALHKLNPYYFNYIVELPDETGKYFPNLNLYKQIAHFALNKIHFTRHRTFANKYMDGKIDIFSLHVIERNEIVEFIQDLLKKVDNGTHVKQICAGRFLNSLSEQEQQDFIGVHHLSLIGFDKWKQLLLYLLQDQETCFNLTKYMITYEFNPKMTNKKDTIGQILLTIEETPNLVLFK